MRLKHDLYIKMDAYGLTEDAIIEDAVNIINEINKVYQRNLEGLLLTVNSNKFECKIVDLENNKYNGKD